MKIICYSLLLLFAAWIINHPNTKNLLKGISSVAIDAPLARAKSEFRTAAEQQAQREAEARVKQIDTAIEASDRGSAP